MTCVSMGTRVKAKTEKKGNLAEENSRQVHDKVPRHAVAHLLYPFQGCLSAEPWSVSGGTTL